VTNPPIGQEMSRRQRRALQEQSFQPAAGSITPTPYYTLVDPPVVPQAPIVQPPPPPPPPPAPPSRRERRQQQSPEGFNYSPAPVAPVDPFAPFAAPAPPADPFAPFSAPAPPADPLPPVFSAPATLATDVSQLIEPAPIVSPSRIVGDMTSMTNSLVLPTMPISDLAGPVSTTGEVVFTGQIRLPQTVSERGSFPSADREDGEVMDAYVTGAIPANIKPLRASQAVSGKTGSSELLMVKRTRWGTAVVVTSLGAAVLGLAAVALVILAVMTEMLG
jgi:hypothetical protein